MITERAGGTGLVVLFTIVNRGQGEIIAEMMTEAGITLNLFTLGMGTAPSKVLDYFGFGETEKDILISTMPLDTSKKMLKRLETEYDMQRPYRGIAFTVPIYSVMEERARQCIVGVHAVNDGEEIAMENASTHELILIIMNKGYTEEVMELARSADATGGTALHARRVGVREAERFFGVSIQPEKEVVMILTPSERRRGIMEAVAEKAGIGTPAKCILFSLPVTDFIGLTDVLPEDE